VPVAAYARDDDAVRARVSDYLASEGLDPEVYDTIIRGYADRPLSAGIGLQSWVALRRYQDLTRITLYLATEASHVFPPGSVPAPTPDRSKFEDPTAVLRAVDAQSLADHPFLHRLRRERSSSALHALVANLYEGSSRYFARWLAMATARVEDVRIRCLLARQLDQELGEDDCERSQRVLVRKLLAALALADGTVDIAIGRRLNEKLAEHYMAQDPAESLAALLAGEIAAHQLISEIGAALQGLDVVLDDAVLESLRIHAELEGSRVEESFMLAQMLPSRVIDSVTRGALGAHHALWVALDELYALYFAKRRSRAS
jgi:hypothetical protein